MFAPEVVLFCAWRQYWEAFSLKRKINSMGDSVYSNVPSVESTKKPEGCPCSRHETIEAPPTHKRSSASLKDSEDIGLTRKAAFVPWTMHQAFFAVMGGFVVESRRFNPSSHLTFTPGGIFELAKAGLLPRISTEVIEDKSKADAIAKLVVCVQASWFLVQSIARVIQGMQLTLLEIHTLTHIGCAFFMYLVWFHKPYSVTSPETCTEPEIVEMAALFALKYRTVSRDGDDHGVDYSSAVQWSCCQTDEVGIEQVRGSYRVHDAANQKPFVHLELANRAIDRLRGRGSHFNWEICQKGELEFNAVYTVFAQSNLHIEGPLHEATGTIHDQPAWFVHTETYLSLFVSALYGGAHLGAWGYQYPTALEQWMWRASGIAMVTCPCLMAVMWSLMDLKKSVRQGHNSKVAKSLGLLISGVQLFPATVCAAVGVVYPFARIFLSAESFASLRSLPPSAYETIEWTNFLPHAA
ncbi:MAG: hypothetical protein M1812_004094 [Candelaria pacifica]|nr:MAG: hypothetical protein M1812_004094 [Candelaria pacifica]